MPPKQAESASKRSPDILRLIQRIPVTNLSTLLTSYKSQLEKNYLVEPANNEITHQLITLEHFK